MRVPCEASTSQPASAPSTRAWRQPGRALQQPWAGALRAARRMRQRQQHTVASAAQDEFAPTKWSPQRDRLADYLPVPAEDSKPAPRRPGYHAFVMDKCEFLVAETPDGQLDLSDVFLLDGDSDVFARPAVYGEVPAGPRHYQIVEVGAEYLGNLLEDKDYESWVYQVFLIPIRSQDPYELDLSQVFLLDGKSHTLSNQPVTWLAPKDTPKHALRLRVRRGTITVEGVDSLPSWEDVVQAHEAGLSALSKVECDMLNRAAAGEVGWEDVERVVGEEYVHMWQQEGVAMGGAAGGAVVEAQSVTLSPAEELLHDKLAEEEVDENLKDFVPEYEDEQDSDGEVDFDTPAADY